MSFDLPGDVLASRDAARIFGEERIFPSVIERDQGHLWSQALFEQMGRAGLLGAPLPAEHGGGGKTALETSLMLEGFGSGACDAGLALAWGAHTLLCGASIAAHGTPDQQKRALPDLATGARVGAFAADEPDPVHLRTRAERRGSGFVLTGEKTFVVNAPVAHLFVVTAVTDPERGADGISAFLVDRSAAGLHVAARPELSGMRTATIGTLMLDGCEVPGEALLGPAGGGLTHVVRVAHLWERALLLAPWLGLLRAMIDRSARHARERVELGRPVASFQTTRAKLADMTIRLELSRRMIHRAASEIDRGEPDMGHAAIAKLFVAQRARESANDALQIHGLSGLAPDAHVERWARDAMWLSLVGGSTEHLGSVVAARILEPR